MNNNSRIVPSSSATDNDYGNDDDDSDDESSTTLQIEDEAGETLVNRLLDILGEGIAERRRSRTSRCTSSRTATAAASNSQQDGDEGITNDDDHDEVERGRGITPSWTANRDLPPKGISLPAMAMDWLVQRYFHYDYDHGKQVGDETNDNEDRKRLLLSLLRHVQSLRVTLDPWPPTLTSSSLGTTTATMNASTNTKPVLAQQQPHPQRAQLFVSTMKRRPNIDLRPFTKLQVLWLDRIPIEWIDTTEAGSSGGSSSWTQTLQVLRITQSCIYNLRESPLLLVPAPRRFSSSSLSSSLYHHNDDNETDRIVNGTAAAYHNHLQSLYPSLTHLQLSYCRLHDGSGLMQWRRRREMIPSPPSSFCLPPTLVRLSHRLRSIDLSHNELRTEAAALAGLGVWRDLQKLDLSYNHLSSVSTIYLRTISSSSLRHNNPTMVRLRILNLSHNQLVDVTGLDGLLTLVTLRLDHNRLTDLQDTANRLAGLVQLKHLSLEGNPLQYVKNDDDVSSNYYNHRQKIIGKKKRRINESYRLDLFNAFRERRFGSLTATDFVQLTLRSVQELLPILDDRPATLSELRRLRCQTFVPVRFIPLAVQLASHQTTTTSRRQRRRARVATPIVDGDVMTGWQRRPALALSPPPGQSTSSSHKSARHPTVPARFSAQDVVQYLSTNPEWWGNAAASAVALRNKAIGQFERSEHVPVNVMVVATTPSRNSLQLSDREEWEVAFADNIALRYLTSADQRTNTMIVTKNNGTINAATNRLIHGGGGGGVDQNKTRPAARSVVVVTEQKPEVAGSDTTVRTLTLMMDDPKIIASTQDHDTTTMDLIDLTLSTIKDDVDDMKGSGTTTVTTTASTQPGQTHPRLSRSSTPDRTVPPPSSLLKTGMVDQHNASYATPQGNHLPQHVAPFSDHHWQDDNSSVPSSLGTPYRSDNSGVLTKWELLKLAEENSKFEGPYMYQKLLVHSQLDLYFEQFVFAEPKKVSSEIWYDTLCQYPKIGLWPVDRKRRDEASQSSQHFSLNGDDREVLRRVWKETIVPCGKHALRRLTPKRSERYGFHGELLWTATKNGESMRPDIAIDARQVICCNSDKFFYIVIDHDTATSSPKSGNSKQFPRPLPKKAVFRNAWWPHAICCHSFDTLERITIGFSFQRLTLQFRHASSNEVFVYLLLTASKVSTVGLLKEFQELAGNAKGSGFGVSSAPTIEIDNDDPLVLDAIGNAVAPDSLGVVLHYQIVRQRWKHGDRGLVRRVCILTDSNIYLMDEDYDGDGSTGNVATRLGHSSNRLVDGATLNQIVEVQAARDDPTAITIVLRLASLSKPHNWRLVCRTKEGAEKLVDDVRKATRGLKR